MEETRIVKARLETHVHEDCVDHLVSVAWRLDETIESFLEDPEHVLFSVGVTGGRLDDGSFVGREKGVAERVLAVALLETTAVVDGH